MEKKYQLLLNGCVFHEGTKEECQEEYRKEMGTHKSKEAKEIMRESFTLVLR